jgi:hypothetical protein
MLDVKQTQVTEAQDQIAALQNQYTVAQIRYQFYSSQQFMNTWEIVALALQGGALIANGIGLILDLTAGSAHLAPRFTAGVAGFGGTPLFATTYGGENIGSSATAFANVVRGIGGILSEAGGMAATVGSYQRRQEEWTLQANLANAEMTQINSQITAAQDRLNIANSELSIQNKQIGNAQAVSDFLTNKYTIAQLYSWMVSQLTTVYTQAYQLAFSLALHAQTAYQYELGRPTDHFIEFAYWDSQHKGLTAGDSLLFDLRRMEAQYIANNVRELELTKHFSLALMQPMALVLLLQTGTCTISLDEPMFDRDQPGLYFRRLRSVALTIPCITGPYTGVNATLALGSSVVRTVPPSAGFQPWIWAASASNNDPGINAAPAVSATPIIATSSGQNDAGMFEVNLRDERWLPFEGQGAVSQMILTLDPRDNNFDISSVTDVVLHIRYSARPGGDAEAVRTALKPQNARSILVSTRNTFGDAYYSFFNPTDTTATQQSLILPLTDAMFPFFNLGTPSITDVTTIMVFAEPMSHALKSALGSGLAINAGFGLTSATTPAAVVLHAVNGTAPGGRPDRRPLKRRHHPRQPDRASLLHPDHTAIVCAPGAAEISERPSAARPQPDERYRAADRLQHRISNVERRRYRAYRGAHRAPVRAARRRDVWLLCHRDAVRAERPRSFRDQELHRPASSHGADDSTDSVWGIASARHPRVYTGGIRGNGVRTLVVYLGDCASGAALLCD